LLSDIYDLQREDKCLHYDILLQTVHPSRSN